MKEWNIVLWKRCTNWITRNSQKPTAC